MKLDNPKRYCAQNDELRNILQLELLHSFYNMVVPLVFIRAHKHVRNQSGFVSLSRAED